MALVKSKPTPESHPGSAVTTVLLCLAPVLQPSVDDYMGVVKRSPSPPEACRNQLLSDWWVQQPSAGKDGSSGAAPLPTWGGGRLGLI